MEHDDSLPRVRHRGDEPHLLREIVRTNQVLMAGFSREMGIPAARFALMRLIANAGDDIGTMELARRLGVNAAAVTRQLNDMEREGLVLRDSVARDARRSNVRLSPSGLRLFRRVHDRTHALEQALAETIGVEEMRRAASVLARLRQIVEERARGGER